MVQHKPTPEEQLLKLIENPDAAQKAEAEQSSGTKTTQKGRMLGGTFKGFPGFFSKSFSGAGKAAGIDLAGLFNLKWINRFVLSIVLATVAYLIFDLFFLKYDPSAYLAPVSTVDPVYPVMKEPLKAAAEDVDYYQMSLQRRNPFLPVGMEIEQEAQGALEVPTQRSERMTDVLEGLTLVGVSSGVDGPLAMIEDMTTGRTYFLKKSEQIRGIKIQSISREKVTVTYEGEEGTLF